MVTVIDYAVRQSEDGKEFIMLKLQGDLEMVKSKESGRFYATVRKASIVSTLDEASVKQVIGQKLSGTIKKVPCEPFDYTNPETGEVRKITYRYRYVPEESNSVPVQQKEVKAASNGVAGVAA